MKRNYSKLISVTLILVVVLTLFAFPTPAYAGGTPGEWDQIHVAIYSESSGDVGTQIGGDDEAYTVAPGAKLFVVIQANFTTQSKDQDIEISWREEGGTFAVASPKTTGSDTAWEFWESNYATLGAATAHFTGSEGAVYIEDQDSDGGDPLGLEEFWFVVEAPTAPATYELALTEDGVVEGQGTISQQILITLDATPPTVSAYLPLDDATDVAVNATLKLTFDEDMAKGTGDIVIYNSDETVFETIDVTSETLVTISGADVTINPAGTFTSEAAYYVFIDATALDDDAGNTYAGIADKTTWNFTCADIIPPEAITDLAAATGTNGGEVDLTWTAPGDDGATGTATTYAIKYSTATIDEAAWAGATTVSSPPSPKAAGTSESFTVTGLTGGTTYYFAIKTSDEVPNESTISNSPSATAKTAITQLAFTTGAQTITAGEVSAVMTVKTDAAVTEDTEINLSSSSETGTFYSDVAGTIQITSVIIPSNSDKVNFYYKDTTAGTPTITASESPDQGWTDATQQQTITPASLHHFTFSPVGNQTAGIPFSITITAEDEFENTVTGYTGTNSLSDSTGTISPTTTGAFTSGVWTGDVTITTAQTGVQITTIGDSISKISDPFDVTPASLHHFTFSTISNQSAGAAFSITITAKDEFGNTVTGYTGTNSLSDSTGTISPATTGAFTSGAWTGDVTITTAQTGVQITTTKDSISEESNPFNVITGAIAQLAFTTGAQTITAGEASTVMTIQTQDNLYNPANVPLNIKINLSSTSGTGTFYSDAAGTIPITSVTIYSGTDSASFYYQDTTAGTPTITAAEDPSQGWSDATQQETIAAAAVARLVFTTGPQTIGAGNASGTITVQTQDEFGNPSAVAAGTTIVLTSTSAQGKFSLNADPWEDTNLVFIPVSSDSVSFYYQDATDGTPTITAAEFPGMGWTDASQQQTITAPPTVTTGTTTNITTATAVLNGNLTSLGTAASITVSFEWGTTTNYGNETTSQAMTGTGTFTAALSGLNPNTPYYFRAKAAGDGTGYGDDKSFTTNISGGGGGGGGGGAPPAPPLSVLTVDTLGKITKVKVKVDGTLLESFVIATPEGNVSLGLDSGTNVICGNDKVPQRLEMGPREEPLPVPEGFATMSPVYDFIAYTADGTPQPVTFDPPARLLISYDPEGLPENTASVFIAYYDEELGWTQLEPPTGFVAEVGTAAAQVSHFTSFAVMAKLAPPPPPPPARFELSNLDIKPNQVTAGESVTISAQLVNIGGLSGEHTLMVNIEGLLETSQVIELLPGQSQEISFTVTPGSPGSYTVAIDDLEGSFMVEAVPVPPTPEPVEPGGYGWIIAIASAVVVLAVLVTIILRRRHPQPVPVAGGAAKPAPAPLRVNNLRITPKRAKLGKKVTIMAEASNLSADFSSYSLVLRIKGRVEAVKEITLEPGQSQKVAFTILKDRPGTYSVELEESKGSFRVEP